MYMYNFQGCSTSWPKDKNKELEDKKQLKDMYSFQELEGIKNQLEDRTKEFDEDKIKELEGKKKTARRPN